MSINLKKFLYIKKRLDREEKGAIRGCNLTDSPSEVF